MKTAQKITTLLATAFIAVVFLFGNAVQAQAKAKPWPVPEKDKTMKASSKITDAKFIATGKELYAKHCKSCHGAKGMGDGAKAATLKTNPGDFAAAGFQSSTDGEIFYRVSKGRDEMPAYDKKIPDAADRWALVAYMRTFKK